MAIVVYALGAVMGSSEDAWWVAMRAWDAAYARVTYTPQEPAFRSLAHDTAERSVQDELAWQERAVALLELDVPPSHVIPRLRS